MQPPVFQQSTVRIIEGDVLDFNQLKEAIAGQDIVYANLSGDLEAMAKNIVKAMNALARRYADHGHDARRHRGEARRQDLQLDGKGQRRTISVRMFDVNVYVHRAAHFADAALIG